MDFFTEKKICNYMLNSAIKTNTINLCVRVCVDGCVGVCVDVGVLGMRVYVGNNVTIGCDYTIIVCNFHNSYFELDTLIFLSDQTDSRKNSAIK